MSYSTAIDESSSTEGIYLPDFLKFSFDPKEDGSEGTWYAGVPWLSEVEENLRGFLDLESDWDSYGACRVDEGVITTAFKLLLNGDLERIFKPIVVPRKDGGVNFEWDTGGKFLSIEVTSEGLRYFFFNRENEESEENVFREEKLDDILSLIS